MSLPRHLILALTYGVIAIAVALTLPYSIPSIGKWDAIAIGALILLFGAVLHETYSRQHLERNLRLELDRLAAGRDTVMDELSQTRTEMQAIQHHLRNGTASDVALDRVQDEVRILQNLVSRLTGRRAGPTTLDRRPILDQPTEAQIEADGLSEDDLAALLEDAIRRDRIDMALQPIVSLPQRKTRYYEALCRIRTDDGSHILAGRFIDLAERLGLVTAIDNVLLFRCVQLVRDAVRRHRLVGFFANVSVDTLRDAEFMEQFIEFVTGAPELASRLVFEVSAKDFRDAGETLWPPLERLAAFGFRFSVDKVGSLASLDVDELEGRFVRFVKIDAATLIAETRNAKATAGLIAIKQRLEESAIDLIVDRIETEPELVELLDLSVDFGQGMLFGEPRTS